MPREQTNGMQVYQANPSSREERCRWLLLEM